MGQKVAAEELVVSKMPAEISGPVYCREPDDESCLQRIRALVDKMGHPATARFDYKDSENPAYPPEEIYGIFSSDPARQYDMREVIARIVDSSKFEEYRAESGKTLVCGYARVGGGA